MRLKWIAKKHVVMYDLCDRRAWLLDGASALLHLVRASLQRDKNDPFKELFLYQEDSLEESSSPFTGKIAAIHVLNNRHNTALPLYAKPVEVKVEETSTGTGSRSKIRSSTRRDYTLKDRIEDIYEVLEQIMTHQADVLAQDGIGFRVKYTTRRQLEGFNFMDVATDEDPLWPRVTTIKARGRGWIDLTRSLHAITLFGRGFGELLRPISGTKSCAGCLVDVEVPKGQEYLAVCTSELQEILEKRGSKNTTPWRLVDEVYWHTPDKAFETCQCDRISRKHDRVQVLLPSSLPGFWRRGLRSPSNMPNHGAVLFGHSWRFPLRWKDHGEPEEGDPDDEDLEEMEASFHDSGVGTSLGSRGSEAAIGTPSSVSSQTGPNHRPALSQVMLSTPSHESGTEALVQPVEKILTPSLLGMDVAVSKRSSGEELSDRSPKRIRTPASFQGGKGAQYPSPPFLPPLDFDKPRSSAFWQPQVTPPTDGSRLLIGL